MKWGIRATSLGIFSVLLLVLAACGPDLNLLDSPKDLYINDVIVTGTGDGWAVGLQPGRGQPVLLHASNGMWHLDANPPPGQGGDTLKAVAYAGNTLWVAGLQADATHGDATQESGFAFARGPDGVWHRQKFGAAINAITFVSATDGWAVGGGGAIYHDLNGTWMQAVNSMDNILYAVAFRSPTDGWATGEMGAVIHYDGTSWQPQEHFTHEDINGVALTANDGWAVGTEGTVLRLGSNNLWYEVATPLTATLAVHAVAITNGNVWIVGDHGLVFERTDINQQWNHIAPPADAQLNTLAITPTGQIWIGANLGSSAIFDFTNGAWRTEAVSFGAASSQAGS